ncbi:hypothetical protein DMX02_17855 [Pseudomonas jessenii]|nr:hypothetical protein DMX02_17855 [Pseudomonas jessenii]
MSTPDQPLALTELNIPGRSKDPVSQDPDIWGINIAAALGNFPLNGLLCQAGPWGNMAQGDKLTIFWGIGQNVWVETVDKTEVNTQLRMFVPSRHMVDGRFAVSYVVKPLGGTDQASEVMQVLVKLTRPGGHDDNGDGGHSKLIMTIPKEIVDGGIDKDNVAAGVPISIGKADGTPPYPFAAAGDVCRLSWGGIFVLSTALTQEQAEGKAPIIISITEAIIREAGDADFPGMAVAFEVYDKVLNRSEDWSPEQRVVVAVDATRLDAPLLKEAKNNELNLDALAGKPGTAQIVANPSRFELGDIITVRLKGTPSEGAPIDLEVASKPLDNLPSVVELELPNAALMQLATKTFSLSCSVKKADSPPHLHSKSQFISAIGEVQRLAAPIMRDAVSGALDPALPQVRVEIPFDKSFAEGQVLKIFMLGTTPGLKPYLPDLPTRLITRNDIVAAQPLLYNIDGKHLTPVNGGTAEFYYQQLIAETVLATLNPYEATRAIRESIHTEILQVGEARLELPQPEVAGVVDGVLPADTAGTTLTVVYTETVKGDEVFMFWHGSITGEYTDSIKLNEFTAGQPVPFPIGAELIKGNEGGSVIARYEIKRAAGGTSYAEPLTFDVGVAFELKPPQLLKSTQGVFDPMDNVSGAIGRIEVRGHRAGDTVRLIVKGAAGDGSPTLPAKAPDTNGVADFTLNIAFITANLGRDIVLGCELIREGKSTPGPDQPFKILKLSQRALTTKPWIVQAGNDTHLDVSTLTTNLECRMGDWPFIKSGQPVWLAVQSTNNNGSPFLKLLWKVPGAAVNPTWISQRYYSAPPLALSDVRNLKDGCELTMTFKVGSDLSQVEDDATVAPVRTYTIKAFATPLQPSLKEAAGSNSLNPFAAKDTLTVVVPHYTGMASTDQISVTWTGATGTPDGGSHTSTAVPVGTVGAKEIPIPNTVVAFNLGKAVTVFYTVIRNGTPTKSEEFTLNVQTIPNEDSRLPNPIINTNTTSELDVITLPANAQTRIAAWLLIKQGQKLWMRYFVEGNPTPISTTYNGDSVPAGVESSGMYPNTPVNELKALANGARLRIEFKVGFDGSTDESKAVVFPSRTYTVKKRVTVSGSEDFERESIRQFVFNTPARFGSGLSVTATNKGNGPHPPGVFGYSGTPKPPTFYYLGLYTGTSAITRFEVFEGPIKAIRFLYEHARNANDRAIFFDDNGQVIGTKYLTTYNGTPIAHVMEFKDDRLAHFELHINLSSGFGIIIDAISWS